MNQSLETPNEIAWKVETSSAIPDPDFNPQRDGPNRSNKQICYINPL